MKNLPKQCFKILILVRGRSLSEVITAVWQKDSEEILQVMNADETSGFRHRILNSLIDKLDYLARDSVHLGIKFGESLDQDRLIRNLTLAYKTKKDRETHQEKLDFVGIGVTEKALVVAQSVWRGRKDMFTQVYWQHTTRAVKAMLGFIVRRVLIRLDSEEVRATFWYAFRQFVFSPMQPSVVVNPPEPIGTLEDDLGIAPVPRDITPSSCSHLYPSDDQALMFFWQFASSEEKLVIRAIQDRRLYRRLAVLSGVRKPEKYKNIYSRFRNYRLEEEYKAIEDRTNDG